MQTLIVYETMFIKFPIKIFLNTIINTNQPVCFIFGWEGFPQVHTHDEPKKNNSNPWIFSKKQKNLQLDWQLRQRHLRSQSGTIPRWISHSPYNNKPTQTN